MSLVTGADVAAYLGMSEEVADANAERLDSVAAAAEASLAGLCGRQTFLVTDYVRTVRVRPFQTAIVLPVRPVVSEPAVQLGDAQSWFAADVSTGADTVRVESHGFITGAGPFRAVPIAGASLPTGLVATTDYYVIVVDEDHVQFAASADLAEAGTEIDLTVVGSGRTMLVGPLTPRSSYSLDPVGGIVRFVSGFGAQYEMLVTLTWRAGLCTSASDAPADLLGWITKYAALEFLEGGRSGRLGNSGQDKQTGVQAQYSPKDFPRGVVEGMSRYVLRGIY